MFKAISTTFQRLAQRFVGTSRQEEAEDNHPGFTLEFALQSVYAPLAPPRAKAQKNVNVPDVPVSPPPDTKLVWVGSHATPVQVPAK